MQYSLTLLSPVSVLINYSVIQALDFFSFNYIIIIKCLQLDWCLWKESK